MPARILIVDDHEVVRQGIRTILKARPQWEVCGEAANGREAIEQTKALKPDVVIMDITMPEMSGIEATRELTRQNVPGSILIFTMHESSNLADTVREAGARGFVLKSRAARDLLDALETLMGGGTFFGADPGKSAKPKAQQKEGAMFCVSLQEDRSGKRAPTGRSWHALGAILACLLKISVDASEEFNCWSLSSGWTA
jgi:DNA-binding NarL/FixJ family response regulator